MLYTIKMHKAPSFFFFYKENIGGEDYKQWTLVDSTALKQLLDLFRQGRLFPCRGNEAPAIIVS